MDLVRTRSGRCVASGSNSRCHDGGGHEQHVVRRRLGCAPAGAPTFWNSESALGRSTMPSTVTATGSRPARADRHRVAGRGAEVGGGLLVEQHTAGRPGEVADLGGERVAVAVGDSDDLAGAGRLRGGTVGRFEAGRRGEVHDLRGIDRRVGGDGRGHRRQVGAGLGLDLPVDRHRGDGPSGHRRLRGGEEGAERREQSDGEGDADRRRPEPAADVARTSPRNQLIATENVPADRRSTTAHASASSLRSWRSVTRRPSCIVHWRSRWAATAGSWVITTRRRRYRSRSSSESITMAPVAWSSWPVGSSATSQAMPAGDGPGDGHALRLAAGQLVRELARQVVELEPGERVRRRRALRRRSTPCRSSGQGDVLADVERRHQARRLEHDGHRAWAQCRPGADRRPLDRAGRRGVEPGEEVRQAWSCPTRTARRWRSGRRRRSRTSRRGRRRPLACRRGTSWRDGWPARSAAIVTSMSASRVVRRNRPNHGAHPTARLGEPNDPIGARRERRVVGGHDHGRTGVRGSTQQRGDAARGQFVDLAGRLVGQHDRRVRWRGRRRGRLGPPRRPTGSRPATGAVGQSDGVEQFGDAVAVDAAGEPLRQQDVPATLRWSKRLPLWNSTPIFRARSDARARSGRRVIGSPATRTGPPSGSSRPARQASSVDLPDPEGPTTATISPRSTRSDTPPQGDRLVVGGVEEPVEVDGLDRSGRGLGHGHVSESVTYRHGSTLSAPLAPASVRIATVGSWKNS